MRARKAAPAFALPLMLALAGPALAQATPKGSGPDVKNPDQIQMGETAVLPDADISKPSAAPTMAKDCVKDPASCRGDGPVTGSAPAAGMPAQSK